MIAIYHRTIEGIPLLELVSHELTKEKLPPVIFFHGWLSFKERVLTHGYELAKQGFRVLLPEALYHGERADNKPTADHQLDFWKIVGQNVKDIDTLVKCYEEQDLIDPKRLGISGLSMGGITVCAAMKQYANIKAAACLMGTPYAQEFARGMIRDLEKQTNSNLNLDVEHEIAQLASLDLSLEPAAIKGRPFYFWHGKNDQMVPYQPTYDFYQKYKNEEYGQKMEFTTTDGGHDVPYEISVASAAFFAKNL